MKDENWEGMITGTDVRKRKKRKNQMKNGGLNSIELSNKLEMIKKRIKR